MIYAPLRQTEQLRNSVTVQIGSDYAKSADHIRSTATDIRLARDVIEVNPFSVLACYDAFRAQHHTVFGAVRKCLQRREDLLFGIVTGGFLTEATKHLIRMVMMVVIVIVVMATAGAMFTMFMMVMMLVMIMMMTLALLVMIMVMMAFTFLIMIMVMMALTFLIVIMVMMALTFLIVIMVMMTLAFFVMIVVVMMRMLFFKVRKLFFQGIGLFNGGKDLLAV